LIHFYKRIIGSGVRYVDYTDWMMLTRMRRSAELSLEPGSLSRFERGNSKRK